MSYVLTWDRRKSSSLDSPPFRLGMQIRSNWVSSKRKQPPVATSTTPKSLCRPSHSPQGDHSKPMTDVGSEGETNTQLSDNKQQIGVEDEESRRIGLGFADEKFGDFWAREARSFFIVKREGIRHGRVYLKHNNRGK
ncbi:hypothetical protein V6N11_010851 [Hibiscus sabdariffa]|uniref:Uncharacterized protein n=1 Tax=Hibiscus sabdariffa TaxID=183260 RepID=A0ABR2S7D2_9ROSI